MDYKLVTRVLLATSLMLQPLLQVTQAEEGISTPDTVRVFVGGFFAQLDTDTRVTSSGLGGRKISLEDDLGLDDDDTVFFAGLRWRISKRHSVSITQLVLDRDGDQTVTRELAIGDKVFPINTAVVEMRGPIVGSTSGSSWVSATSTSNSRLSGM